MRDLIVYFPNYPNHLIGKKCFIKNPLLFGYYLPFQLQLKYIRLFYFWRFFLFFSYSFRQQFYAFLVPNRLLLKSTCNCLVSTPNKSVPPLSFFHSAIFSGVTSSVLICIYHYQPSLACLNAHPLPFASFMPSAEQDRLSVLYYRFFRSVRIIPIANPADVTHTIILHYNRLYV